MDAPPLSRRALGASRRRPTANGTHVPTHHLPDEARPPLGLADPRRRKLLAWAIPAAVGGLAFGYNLGVISGALLFIQREFGLNDFEQGALAGVLPLGAMVGGLLAGRLADGLGRRRTLMLDGVVFIAATALAVVAPSYLVLLAARAIVGLAVGAASSTVPLYLSEIAPPAIRGRLVTLNQLMVVSGILASYCADWLFAGSGSWRAMFAVGLLPPAALLVGMLRAPETPAWLDAHGESDRAREVALQVADEAEAERLLDGFRRARAREARQLRATDLLRSSARPALIVGVTLAAVQQFSGINTIIYYAPRIMQHTGLSASNSILYSVIIGVVNVVATVVSIRLVDRAGRRRLLLVTLPGMFVSLVLLGLTFTVSLGSADSWLSLVCILAYITAFGVGLGPVFWLLITEIFPPPARAAGASVSTAFNWLSNFVVGLAFLSVASAIGQGPTFWIFAAVSAVAYLFVDRYVPETQGRDFSEIDAELRARWGDPRTARATSRPRC